MSMGSTATINHRVAKIGAGRGDCSMESIAGQCYCKVAGGPYYCDISKCPLKKRVAKGSTDE